MEMNPRKSEPMPACKGYKQIVTSDIYNSIKQRLMVGGHSGSTDSSSLVPNNVTKTKSSEEQFTCMEEILSAQQQFQNLNETVLPPRKQLTTTLGNSKMDNEYVREVVNVTIATSSKERKKQERDILVTDTMNIFEKNTVDIASCDSNSNVVAASMDSHFNNPVDAGPFAPLNNSNEDDLDLLSAISKDDLSTTPTLSLGNSSITQTTSISEKIISVKPKLKSVQRCKTVPQVSTPNPSPVQISVDKLAHSIAKHTFFVEPALIDLSSREETLSSQKLEVETRCSKLTSQVSPNPRFRSNCGSATQCVSVRDLRYNKGKLKQDKNTQLEKSEQWAWGNGRIGLGAVGPRPKLNINHGAPKVDMFHKAPHVSGGIGEKLLQKMGWRKGEGLGKANEGDTEPIKFMEIKTDRKGLASQEEKATYKLLPKIERVVNKSGKHPVSALMDISARRKWKQPKFYNQDCKGGFKCTVEVNGWFYTPVHSSRNKKTAKAESARNCLIQMGIWPAQF